MMMWIFGCFTFSNSPLYPIFIGEGKGMSEQLHHNLLPIWTLPHLLMPLGAALSQ